MVFATSKMFPKRWLSQSFKLLKILSQTNVPRLNFIISPCIKYGWLCYCPLLPLDQRRSAPCFHSIENLKCLKAQEENEDVFKVYPHLLILLQWGIIIMKKISTFDNQFWISSVVWDLLIRDWIKKLHWLLDTEFTCPGGCYAGRYRNILNNS